MQIKGAIEKTTASATNAKFFQRIPTGLNHTRFLRQPEIIIGGHRNGFLPVNDNMASINLLDFLEIRVNPQFLGLLRSKIAKAFCQNPFLLTAGWTQVGILKVKLLF